MPTRVKRAVSYGARKLRRVSPTLGNPIASAALHHARDRSPTLKHDKGRNLPATYGQRYRRQ
ncbi:protein of unknown function [Paraburkholderia dioscoreae]|uniref:Uncharacterized protein n=1 Tax=Paraburkholderia dioscoreae TaxID=2604047 RepID=A0A5Q4YV10_9BURK|nr:protein of unknown function [Paraburkholderia dioscoreae]